MTMEDTVIVQTVKAPSRLYLTSLYSGESNAGLLKIAIHVHVVRSYIARRFGATDAAYTVYSHEWHNECLRAVGKSHILVGVGTSLYWHMECWPLPLKCIRLSHQVH